MGSTILITGVTGGVSSQLIAQLKRPGAPVRAMVHSEAKAQPLKDEGFETVVGDYDRPETLRAALEGVGTVFLVAPPHPKADEWNATFIKAAKESGSPRIVRLSAVNAAVDGPTANTRLHGASDDRLVASGLPYVILRPHFFMQNLFMSIPTIKEQGVMYWGMGDGRLSMIDTRDIADCAAKVLVDSSFDGGIFTLTGPECITFAQAAAAISEALGRPVTYQPVPPEAVAQAIRDMGMGEWAAGVMRDYSRAYASGWGDFTTPDVERIIGRPGHTFADFARTVLAPAIRNA